MKSLPMPLLDFEHGFAPGDEGYVAMDSYTGFSHYAAPQPTQFGAYMDDGGMGLPSPAPTPPLSGMKNKD
jgi:hypothetical protein